MASSYIPVSAKSTSNYPNITYTGYSIESTINEEFSADGVVNVAGDWVLITLQTDTTQNGLYFIRQLGAFGVPGQHWILVREGLGAKMYHNMFFKVLAGFANNGKSFRLNTADPITPGSTSIPDVDFIETIYFPLGPGPYNTNVLSTNRSIVFNPGATPNASTYKGKILADNGAVVLNNGTVSNPSNATFKGNVLSATNTILLENGTTSNPSNARMNVRLLTTDSGHETLFTAGPTEFYGIVKAYSMLSTVNNGTVPANVTAVEYGNQVKHKTVLTVSGLTIGTTAVGGGNRAISAVVYTLPQYGTVVSRTIYSCYFALALSCAPGDVSADTPDLGIGTTNVTGEAQALLSGCTAGAESIVTGQTAPNVSGTVTKVLISNQVWSSPMPVPTLAIPIYISMADNWAVSAGGCTVTATGTVILEWTTTGLY